MPTLLGKELLFRAVASLYLGTDTKLQACFLDGISLAGSTSIGVYRR